MIAAIDGATRSILLPERGNLRLVEWAASAQIAQVLSWGCRVYLSPPPFDHSEQLVIDNAWSLVCSANRDPRSLRLNFEYDLEWYSAEFAARLDAIIDTKIANSWLLPLAEIEGHPILHRLRDGVATKVGGGRGSL